MAYHKGSATIYARQELGLGFVRLEVKEISFGDDPESIAFKQKRARKFSSVRDTAIILDGWGHPDLDNYVITSTNETYTAMASRYSSADPNWERDFDAFIAEHSAVAHCVILADYRRYTRSEQYDDLYTPCTDPFAEFEADGSAVPPDDALGEARFENAKAVYFEGEGRDLLINAYERNLQARQRCIELFGASCCVCGFNFYAVYGEQARDLIHIQHLTPLSCIGKDHEVDPARDLRPVCANCHAVIHRREPPYSIEDVKLMLSSTEAK